VVLLAQVSLCSLWPIGLLESSMSFFKHLSSSIGGYMPLLVDRKSIVTTALVTDLCIDVINVESKCTL